MYRFHDKRASSALKTKSCLRDVTSGFKISSCFESDVANENLTFFLGPHFWLVNVQVKNTADVVRALLARSTTSRHDVIEVSRQQMQINIFFENSCEIVKVFQLKQFAIELLHRKIDFTACGLFSLDRTLLHSVSRAT